ncbi:aminodeoxychorismate synthase component I [Gandjariella thermophila]|uniref:Aminodeoxychorismate synthase component I n=1 Tax=Gandjariella thermophila TaxID=1931992 RepID=A0A4D4J325_9PSEU|nr:aminodeoxychorismate synthase component I [Gandjariella thermophila]GDY29844.1 aminodeoxychorismate synthase component I [Gandjariella thermophila]
MRVVSRLVGADVSPERVFRRLVARAEALRLPPPAGLVGDWFGAAAVLAPTLRAEPVAGGEALRVPDRQPVVAEAPPGAVAGGWFGYLGYGLADPPHRSRRLPDAAWGWADHVLRLDAAGRWWFEALTGAAADGWATTSRDDAAALAGEMARLLAGDDPPPRPWAASPLRRPPARRHRDAVRGCVDAIAAGEIFQANICSRFDGELAGDPAEVFAEGVARLRPARAAYLSGAWGAVASFSPELFLARHGDRVTSCPIKGTLPRRGPADDGNARLLRASTKDVAENVMIVDLVRNDLGRVCATGTVTVPELLAVHPAPGVWHLVSTVRGRLRPDATDADLLAAAFPPGSVTGAPKLRALELIAELEPEPREVYCGSVGLASPVAGLELNVAIRTLEAHAGRVWLGVGGGITADSDPDAEWQECLHKAAPLEALLTTPAAAVGLT